MIRVYLMYFLIAAVMVRSTRDWIFGICGCIVLSALAQHEDMPRQIGGIPGLNPTNVLLLWTAAMWFIQRRRDQVKPKLHGVGTALLGFYLIMNVVAWLQGVTDVDSIAGPLGDSPIATGTGFTLEFLVNPIKYLVPAFLLYNGLDTRRRFYWVIASLGIMSTLYALIVIKNIPIATLFDEDGYMATRRRIQRQTGLHANDMALIMTQAVWGMIVYARFAATRLLRIGAVGATGALALAVLLCHSRGGYGAFVATGLVVGVVCWRRLLVLLVPAIVTVCVAVPTIPARVLTGVNVGDVSGSESNDWDSITAGRTTFLWPAALAQVGQAPVLGVGRLAILRTGMYERILATEDACPTHPHNAYLEMWCDAGLIGVLIVLVGLAALLMVGARMSWDGHDANVRFTGALCLVTVVPLAVMAMSGQSFWPRENVFPAACVFAVALRVWTLRSAAAQRRAHAQSVHAPGRAVSDGRAAADRDGAGVVPQS